jgi:zinc/manganese transport system ATP-binding protein
MSIIELDGVGVRLGGRQILSDVSFQIREGEFTGLIGPNGAGKTTLLRVILGLQAPTSGRVINEAHHQIVRGGRAARRDSGRRASVGYVPQKLVIDQDMPLRARDVVSLGIDGHRLGFRLPSKQRRDRVDEALRSVDADRSADARVGELSGGEQQRVLIAHALIARPRLLLLDEPLASLDLRSEKDIVALLAKLSREQGIAVLISSHDMNPLVNVMDRIVYVARGRAATGSTAEVVTSASLSELYGHHVDVLRLHNRIIVLAGEEDADTSVLLDHQGTA